MDWIMENKEWLFSGVGVKVIGVCFSALVLVVSFFWVKRKRNEKSGISVTAKKGDVVVSVGGGAANLIKNSNVGAAGDNITVNGGIHMGNNKN